MTELDAERLGETLAAARKRGSPAAWIARDLHAIASLPAAEAVQAAAALAVDQTRIGWTLAATSPITARLLDCAEPIAGPLFAEDCRVSGASLTLRPAMLGVGAQFAFTFGRSYPAENEAVGPDTIADAIVSCRPALQILGRRVPAGIALNSWLGTADFGLAEACVLGPVLERWRTSDLADAAVWLKVDGHVCATGNGRDTLGDPLAPLLWLAGRLAEQGRAIDAGDVVATGSCTGLVQLTPGHVVTGQFDELGRVDLSLV